VEMLDVRGNPKSMLSTFDDVVFRFWYHTKRPAHQEAVEFELRDLTGARVLLLSTWPDDTLRLPPEVGTRSVDCVLEKVPFAAGEYVLGGRVSIPYVEWLWMDLDMARLTVFPRDVYSSGLAPKAPRSLTAVNHTWRLCP